MPTVKVIRKTYRKIVAPRQRRAGVKVGLIGAEVDKGVWNEFGTRGGASGGGWGGPVPERPFMRNTLRENKGAYTKALRGKAKDILLGTTSINAVMTLLGIQVQGDIQAMITTLSTPPNSPVTIALKGSSNPLIDTGAMRQAVTWKLGR